MLVRPGVSDGVEVLMVRRSARSAFAPDAFVFPGGTVDPQDAADDAIERTFGTDGERLRSEFRAIVPQQLPSTEEPVGASDAAALYRAAIRELFEEAGILIARTRSGDPLRREMLLDREEHAALERLRQGDGTLATILREHDWFADATALSLFSHWITPPTEPRRYNTHFFLGIAPPAQDGLADAFETHDEIWISPAEALERNRAQTFHLVYPTIKHLERLQAFNNVEDLWAFTKSKPIVTIMPATSPSEGFVMPSALEGQW
jgi:8-oxo-dGTP pyrophosphatase MutT (NUDIX family)